MHNADSQTVHETLIDYVLPFLASGLSDFQTHKAGTRGSESILRRVYIHLHSTISGIPSVFRSA